MDECALSSSGPPCDEDGFCDIHVLMQHYDIPPIAEEDGELITLRQGDILVFFAVYLTAVVLFTR